MAAGEKHQRYLHCMEDAEFCTLAPRPSGTMVMEIVACSARVAIRESD